MPSIIVIMLTAGQTRRSLVSGGVNPRTGRPSFAFAPTKTAPLLRSGQDALVSVLDQASLFRHFLYISQIFHIESFNWAKSGGSPKVYSVSEIPQAFKRIYRSEV